MQRFGVQELDQLKEDLLSRSQRLDRALQKADKAYQKALDTITKPAAKLAAELLKKQAAKRLVSLALKAVPVVNVLSLAWDLYDAYTLVRDLSESYLQADTQLDIDADLDAQAAQALVDINDIPLIVVELLEIIGAGGLLLTLTQEQVDRLEALLEEHFPEGKESEAYLKFLFDYGDVFEVERDRIDKII